MPITRVKQTSDMASAQARFEVWPVLVILCISILIHLLAGGRYGFYRDELQFLSDARHLDWGFVAYPPIAPFLARISMSLFGLSLSGLRLFPSLALAAILVVTALMTWELGGRRIAQISSTLAIGFSMVPIDQSGTFSYSSFDYLWWVLAAYFTIRLLKSEDSRWWLAIGMVEGFGLLTKYSIAYLIAGILCGALFTRARRYLISGWFWGGSALALLLWMPNVMWQFQHDFISYRFLQYIHARDVNKGLTDDFLSEQFGSCANWFAAPLWLAGLVGYLRSQRYRMLAWMYLVPFSLFLVTKGRFYYLAPAYPTLIAMGSVMGERWIGSSSKPSASVKTRRAGGAAKPNRKMRWSGRQWTGAILLTGLVLSGAFFWDLVLPFFEREGRLRDFTLARNERLREEFGWEGLVRTVAGIRDSLPMAQRANLGIMVGNYGEEGAFAVLGPTYHLPQPISTINSGWLRGYPASPPTTLIVVGFRKDMAFALFSNCKLAGRNLERIKNKESSIVPEIFLCGPPQLPWAEFWNSSIHFE